MCVYENRKMFKREDNVVVNIEIVKSGIQIEEYVFRYKIENKVEKCK